MTILKAALRYADLGLSVIPTNSQKRPSVPWTKELNSSWKPYQNARATPEEINWFYSSEKSTGVAVVCGSVSGSLEVIDVDSKYDVTGSLFEDFIQAIADYNFKLAASLVIAKTINGGYHVYYRCQVIAGNDKLARRPATEEELKLNKHNKVQVLIETRGEGGYVVAAPTIGYEFVQGGPDTIPAISSEDREAIFEIARSFNTYYEVTSGGYSRETTTDGFSLSPLEDFNKRGDIVALLTRHGWKVVRETDKRIFFKRPGATTSATSGDYNKELEWFSVFTTSSEFEPGRAYRLCAVYAVLECKSNYSEAARRLLAEGYGRARRKIDKKVERFIRDQKAEGKPDEKIIESLKISNGLNEADAEEAVKDFNANAGAKIETFWSVNPEKMRITIVLNKLERFLTDVGGFHLFFYDAETSIFKLIRDDNGLIEEATSEQIRKFVKRYILSLPGTFDNISREDLLEEVYKRTSEIFKPQFFEFIDRADISFLNDTTSEAFFPFKNGVVVVTKDDVKLKTYGELGKSVWRRQIIDHDISIEDDVEPETIDFYRFIKKISNDDPDRIEYALSIVGYLLHKYKDRTKSFAIVLGEETPDEAKGGGTGKGIFTEAIAKLTSTQQVDGKTFKPDKTFAMQRVNLDTKLLAIQDTRKNFDFEGTYSMITDGLTIEKKNKDEIYLTYANSPKIVFTTNYSIGGVANHAVRRKRTLEFGGFFSPKNTPLDYFGHRLFDDWDTDQYNKFYNFMFSCVQQYLEVGVPDVSQSEGAKSKHISTAFGEEFALFFIDYLNNGYDQITLFSDLYSRFLAENELEKKDYSAKRFKKALEDAATLYGYKVYGQKNRQAGNKMEIVIDIPGLEATVFERNKNRLHPEVAPELEF